MVVPDTIKDRGVYPVFHPWKLHLAPDNPYPGQVQEPGPAYIIFDDNDDEAHEEWEVLEVVDCRESGHGTQYKIIFTGNWEDWNSNPP